MDEKATEGRVVASTFPTKWSSLHARRRRPFPNVEFKGASAESLPFREHEFTHAFRWNRFTTTATWSGLARNKRVSNRAEFCTPSLISTRERPSHQWVEQLKVPVQLLSTSQYRSLFEQAGFVNVRDQRVIDSTPVPDDYVSGSFKTRDDFVEYRTAGSLMISGEAVIDD